MFCRNRGQLRLTQEKMGEQQQLENTQQEQEGVGDRDEEEVSNMCLGSNRASMWTQMKVESQERGYCR